MAAARAGGGEAIDALYERLQTYIENEQDKKALKTADEILALDANDEDAHRVKITALLQLGDCEAALQAISKSKLGQRLQFEKAYCLYRLGKVDEGLKELGSLVSGGPQSDPEAAARVPAALELAAQLHYRLGHSRECIQLYDSLFQQHKADSLQLRTNVLAAYVSAGLSREIPDLMSAMKLSTRDSFEVGYNRACGLVETGQWSAAETELKMAIKLGRETLFEEELSDDQVEKELMPLTVQLAYVLGRQGRGAEAQELYDKVAAMNVGDDPVHAPTKAVATNNQFAESGRMDSNPAHKKTVQGAAKKLEGLLADSSKPGSVAMAPALEARMSASQKRLLTLNRALAYFLSGRLEPAHELVAALAKQDRERSAQQQPPHQPQLVPLLQAALLAKEGKYGEADAVLEAFASANPEHALHPQLARAQLALESGAVDKAAAALAGAAALAAAAASGAVLTTRVALHQQLGDAAASEALLDSALSVARQGSAKGDPAAAAAVASCLESLVNLRLKLGKLREALDTYKQLQAVPGSKSAASIGVCARLLRCIAPTADPTAAGSLAKDLPSLAAGTRGLDVDALEGSAAGSRGAAGEEGAAAGRKKRGAEEMEGDEAAADSLMEGKVGKRPPRKRADRKKKKKKRLPKGYNPELPNGGLPAPDPERWLPKWQRSEFRKKKLKSAQREKAAVKGSQGAGKVDEALDRTKSDASKAADGSKAAGQAKQPSLPARSAKKGKK